MFKLWGLSFLKHGVLSHYCSCWKHSNDWAEKENMGQQKLPLSPTEAPQGTAQLGLLFIPHLSKEETFIKNGQAVVF